MDVQFQNEGGIFLAHLLTDAARDWVEENVSGEATFWGGALVIEHRYARDIADGMMDDGLEVS